MQLNGKTVLLVADDIAHRDRLARRLHEYGCDVVTADNGALGVLAALVQALTQHWQNP